MRGARLLLGRWVHLILGGALLTPFFLLATILIPLVFDEVNPFNDFPWQFAAFAVALPLAALGALLFPLLRTLEAAAARSLCGLPADVAAELAEEPADSWAARRRTALWFVAHLTAGRHRQRHDAGGAARGRRRCPRCRSRTRCGTRSWGWPNWPAACSAR
ncbi:hypothetical protein SRIMM317S_01172 [Streptomyces rimosus subsp. rimosus]